MKIILSPTKQMKPVDREPLQLPHFIKDSEILCERLKQLHVDELRTLMKINEKIAMENVQRYRSMTFSLTGSPALYTYNGLQFKHMRVEEFSQEDVAYAQDCIRILSGMYGVLRPMDAIQPYRLEMQTRLPIEGYSDLYAYWGDRLAHFLLQEEGEKPCIINLASKEYARAVSPYLSEGSTYTVTFLIEKAGKLKTESTQVKMARGAMVNWIITQRISSAEELIAFHADGYVFHKELSSATELVFVKRK